MKRERSNMYINCFMVITRVQVFNSNSRGSVATSVGLSHSLQRSLNLFAKKWFSEKYMFLTRRSHWENRILGKGWVEYWASPSTLPTVPLRPVGFLQRYSVKKRLQILTIYYAIRLIIYHNKKKNGDWKGAGISRKEFHQNGEKNAEPCLSEEVSTQQTEKAVRWWCQ